MTLATLGGQPVLILKEGTQRTRGEEARRLNIMAARAVAEAIRTTLGPKGMDKMIVDTLGDITISNDGATILDEMEVRHPAAKMMVDLAKAQDHEVGDGTTTAVVIAGALLAEADRLLRKDVHPMVIVNGFKKGVEEAKRVLDEISEEIKIENDEILVRAAETAMRSKAIAGERRYLAEIAVKAVKKVAEERDGKYFIDLDRVKILKKQGKSLRETEYIDGIVIDKEVVHSGMPKRIKEAKIALLGCPLEIEKTEFSAEVRITDPDQMMKFIEEETNILKDMVDKIKSVGANVVFCQKGIDEIAQHFLAKYGILAVRRISSKDMEKLAKATGGRIVTSLEDLKPESLGYAELVEERKIGEDKMVYVEGCRDPRAVTVVLRGGAELLVEEAERGFHDALCVVKTLLEDPRVVYGGGSVEMKIATAIREYAAKMGGKERLAVEAFADAIESIPSALAQNAGMDPVETILDLRAKHEKEGGWWGVNVLESKISDMKELSVVEPTKVKLNAIVAAAETAQTIIRIDDVIAAKPFEKEEKKEGKEEEEKPESEFSSEL